MSESDEEKRRRVAVVEMCPREGCRVAGFCCFLGPFGTCKLRPPLDSVVKRPKADD